MVLTKPELVSSLQNEVRILLHLASKIDRATLDYRPTPKQRSTLELLQYLTIMGPALVNVAKHANATGAHVSVSEQDGQVVLEVSDDGAGGADAAGGSGLRGLADRVEALDGRLAVTSDGSGTTLRATIPLR